MKFILINIISLGILMTGCSDYKSLKDYTAESFKANSEPHYSYTVYRDQRGYDPHTVLYYFHGSEGDETSWIKSHAGIINEWRNSGRPSPVVVGISFGDKWLLVSGKSGSRFDELLEIFINTIMPSIEKQTELTVKHRFVMGVSMGGFNAAQLVFNHPSYFDRAVLVSPLIIPFSIYGDPREIDNFIAAENSRRSAMHNSILFSLFGQKKFRDAIYLRASAFKNKYFRSRESWERNDIQNNIKKPPVNKHVRVYISCGNDDDAGFYPGSEQLASKTGTLGYSVTWRGLKGGHIVIDEKEIASFLIE